MFVVCPENPSVQSQRQFEHESSEKRELVNEKWAEQRDFRKSKRHEEWKETRRAVVDERTRRRVRSARVFALDRNNETRGVCQALDANDLSAEMRVE